MRWQGFTDVDRSGDAAELATFLDRVARLPDSLERRGRAYAALRLRPGMQVLDAGCGTGDDTRELAVAVTPGGEAVGLDRSAEMIRIARARGGEGVRFEEGSATELPFPDEVFDAYRCERLLHHLDDPARALTEAFRVLRPGGRIAVVEPDFDGVLFAGDVAVTRRIVHAFADAFAAGTVARRLPELFVAAGFTEVDVQSASVVRLSIPGPRFLASYAAPAVAAGALTGDDAADWTADQEARDREGRFFFTFPNFLVTASRR